MKLLVFGQQGQVAQELARRVPPDVRATFLSRAAADLAQPTDCQRAIAIHQPDAVINAAAWTAVDAAEQAEPEATLVNAAAPGAMAQTCARLGIPLLHLSTDYVFNGQGTRAFGPDDPPAPANAYGRSKLAGEQAIRDSGARHLILRTSWVVSAHGRNFIKTMLRLAQGPGLLRVVDDQVGGLTPAAALADALYVALRAMVAGHPGGTYHYAGTPDASWAEVARAVLAAAGSDRAVEPISSVDYAAPAPRPANSRLDCSGFTQDFGVPRPDWRPALADIVRELRGAA